MQRLSGVWADKHSEELKRGITIRLGYADTSFYKCSKCKGYNYFTTNTCPKCKEKATFLRKVSFIDAPGHETLMATMLSGAAIMDGALLVIAANENCPQPQTKEHLMALNIIGIKKIVIVQNKIDLVSEEEAEKNYKEIKEFVKGTVAESSPIIPISAQHNVNLDELIKAIEEVVKSPKRDSKKQPLFFISRSFDVNKPGTDISKLIGGVLGGALKQGQLKIGEEIEIKPGLKIEKKDRAEWQPIITKIAGLKSGGDDIKKIKPGGSAGILTELDPALVKADSLIGNLVGLKGKLPETFYELKIKPTLLERVVGTKEELNVEPIKKNEVLMLNVNSAVSVGTVIELHKNVIEVKLKIPICLTKDSRMTISRNLGSRWRLIGLGTLEK